MKPIDLIIPLAKRRARERSQREREINYHLEEDLIELRRFQVVEAKAIRILRNHIVSESAKHRQETEFSAVGLELPQPDQQLIQVPSHHGL